MKTTKDQIKRTPSEIEINKIIHFDNGYKSHFSNFTDDQYVLIGMSEKYKIDKEGFITQNYYWRLPNSIIDNEVYIVAKSVKSLSDTLLFGSDLDMDRLDSIIDVFQKIKKSAQQFETGMTLPTNYIKA